MAEVDRFPWRSSHLNPLLKAGWAGAGSSGPQPLGLWISLRMIPQPLWAACVIVWPVSWQGMFFSSLNRIFHGLSTLPCPSSGHHWKMEPGSIFFILLHEIFIHIGKILPEPSLIQAEHFQLLSSDLRYSTSFTTFMVLCWTHSYMFLSLSWWGAQNEVVIWGCFRTVQIQILMQKFELNCYFWNLKSK